MESTLKKKPLTDRQQEILDAIRQLTATNGYSPSIRELGDKLDIGSPNGVMCHIRALKSKGYLKATAFTARSLQLTESSEPVSSERKRVIAIINGCDFLTHFDRQRIVEAINGRESVVKERDTGTPAPRFPEDIRDAETASA